MFTVVLFFIYQQHEQGRRDRRRGRSRLREPDAGLDSRTLGS